MDKLFLDIKKNLEKKTTDELMKIYRENDTEVWSKSAFLAIKSILDERSALKANDPTYCHPKDVLCSECGSNNFNYDKLWKEYVCVNCGLIVQDKEKLFSLTNDKSKQKNIESAEREKREQIEFGNSQIPSISSRSGSRAIALKIDHFEQVFFVVCGFHSFAFKTHLGRFLLF